MMTQAFMSGAAVVLYESHDIVVMRQSFSMGSVVFKIQSVAEIFGLSSQLGFEPAPRTSGALAEQYLNDSQLILGN
jgi:hypothetical protein